MTISRTIRRAGSLVVALACAAVLSACALTVPTDPDRTLSTVSGGTLRVGVSEEPGLVEIDGDVATGPLPELVDAFATRIDATPEWTVAGEQTLVQLLEQGELDLAIGAFRGDTPWSDRAAMTRAYADLPGTAGREIVMLAPFVRPHRGSVRLTRLDRAAEAVSALDWKVQDVVLVPVDELPDEANRGDE